MKPIKVNIITPCYNEEDNIEPFYSELIKFVKDYDYKITFIDDGSADHTLLKVQQISSVDNRVQYIRLSRNFGHQSAIKAGIDHVSECDLIIILDVDLQHPPKYIEEMISKWRNGSDIVNGVRQNNPSNLFKRICSTLFYKFINKLSDVKITPNSPDFRLISYRVVLALRTINEQSYFLRFILPWIGYRQENVFFECPNRTKGFSKYTLKKQCSLFIKAISSTSINPLRFSMFFGLFFSFLSFTYATYAAYQFLFNNHTITGWTSIIMSILFIAGVQFILIGLIGEYLGKTFSESKKRPIYIIESNNFKF